MSRFIWVTIVFALGCGGSAALDGGVPSTGSDAGHDAGAPDAAGFDAGAVDAGSDAGGIDAGVADAGLDAGAVDAGAPDAGWVKGACLLNGWCGEHPLPFGSNLDSVQVLAPNDIWVAGASSATYHFDGNSWRYFHAEQDPVYLSTDVIDRIIFTTPDAGWAMSGGAISRWNGNGWSYFTNTRSGYDHGSLVFSPDDVVVARGVYSSQWDGTGWTDLQDWPTGLLGIWGPDRAHLWGVDLTHLRYFDGGTWANVPFPSDGGALYFQGIWGSSANDVWAVGSEGTALHFDGGEWQRIPTGKSEAFGSGLPARFV